MLSGGTERLPFRQSLSECSHRRPGPRHQRNGQTCGEDTLTSCHAARSGTARKADATATSLRLAGHRPQRQRLGPARIARGRAARCPGVAVAPVGLRQSARARRLPAAPPCPVRNNVVAHPSYHRPGAADMAPERRLSFALERGQINSCETVAQARGVRPILGVIKCRVVTTCNILRTTAGPVGDESPATQQV